MVPLEVSWYQFLHHEGLTTESAGEISDVELYARRVIYEESIRAGLL